MHYRGSSQCREDFKISMFTTIHQAKEKYKASAGSIPRKHVLKSSRAAAEVFGKHRLCTAFLSWANRKPGPTTSDSYHDPVPVVRPTQRITPVTMGVVCARDLFSMTCPHCAFAASRSHTGTQRGPCTSGAREPADAAARIFLSLAAL